MEHSSNLEIRVATRNLQLILSSLRNSDNASGPNSMKRRSKSNQTYLNVETKLTKNELGEIKTTATTYELEEIMFKLIFAKASERAHLEIK